MRPFALRPPFFVSFSVSAFSGFDFVISLKSETVMKRRPGDVGLKRRTGISGHPRPSDLRPLEELDRVARLQLHDRLLPAGLRPARGRRRRPRSCRRSSSRTRSASARSGSGPLPRPPFQHRQRRLGDEQRARPDDRAHLELGRRDDRNPLQVPERLREHGLLLGADEHDRARQLVHERGRPTRRRRLERRRVDERERPRLDVAAQGRPERRPGGLPVHLLLEGARRLRERVAAALELRRADRALAGASGALLAPRLRAAAGDGAAVLRLRRARPPGVRLRADGLVDEVRLHLGAEDRLVELARAGPAEHGSGGGHQPRTSTIPFLGPGTEPLTSSRFRSGSTRWTVSPTCVTRLPPIRPAIRTPLKTRDGVADAPTDPGARMLWEPCARGPLEKLWRLIVPWKPLPMPIPDTFTSSPGSKTATVTAPPATPPSIGPRNSTSRRCGPTPKRLRCPSCGRVSLRSGTGSYASWTAS